MKHFQKLNLTLVLLGIITWLTVNPAQSEQPMEKNMKKFTNRLAQEKSPYLLQHKNNPVDWYPWGDEAFQKAKEEDKPIFLSIGYSTCHWCHVMEHESFENEEVANLMNEIFVCIKVDREERPDIDMVYMEVCQMMTGSGGWPLTILMTPDKKPFYAGTYLPRNNAYGRLGMLGLIPKVKEVWANEREKVLTSAEDITKRLQGPKETSVGDFPGIDTLDKGFKQLDMSFDSKYGGFGERPKFPTPHNFLFLLRYYNRTKNEQALQMVEKTLSQMRLGGIYDHIGFGFARYSTDQQWFVPHFEKMLYDQALLSMAFTETFQITKNPKYEQTAREIFTYVVRDMTSPEGGFYSAEDADSEGEEGKFYLWGEKEINKILGEDAKLFNKVFNVDSVGNFFEEASGAPTGTNLFHLSDSLDELAVQMEMKPEELKNKIESCRQKLFEVRENRIHPGKDDKILTDWNGLMIAALSKAARAFDDSEVYKNAAKKSADFILETLREKDGRLLHRYRDGEAGLPSHADDYVFMVWGLLELYETTFEVKYLESALELNGILIEHFWDDREGGFFFTADDGEKLLVRKREIYDGAIPASNSVAFLNLLKLERITGKVEFGEKAEKLIKAFSDRINQTPMVYTFFLTGIDFARGPSYEVVISGKAGSEDSMQMIEALNKKYIPNKVVLFRPEGESPITQIAEYTKNQIQKDEKATAFVCKNFTCNQPTTDINKMLEFLEK